MNKNKAIIAYKKAALILELQPRRPAKKHHVGDVNKMMQPEPRGWHKFINKVMASK